MHSSWKSRGGGPWDFWQTLLRRGTWGCEKIRRGGSFLWHFYVEVFQNLYRGYMRCPPPVCIYGFPRSFELQTAKNKIKKTQMVVVHLIVQMKVWNFFDGTLLQRNNPSKTSIKVTINNIREDTFLKRFVCPS